MTTQSLQYSYSGADCDVFAIRGTNDIKQLKSVATVSVSVYDAKAPVRALGYRSVKGYTRSIRTVAGSIVFIVVEGHPLEDLMDFSGNHFHIDSEELQVERASGKLGEKTIPLGSIFPFNLLLLYKNEIGNGAGLEIDDVEFVSEGIVTSVNDMVTEVVVQFVATDFRQLRRSNIQSYSFNLEKNLEVPIIGSLMIEEEIEKFLQQLGYDPENVYNLPPDIIKKIEGQILKIVLQKEKVLVEKYLDKELDKADRLFLKEVEEAALEKIRKFLNMINPKTKKRVDNNK